MADTPPGHKPFTFEDMGRLTTDRHGNICLDGKPLEVKEMTLTKRQGFLALIGVLAALLGGLAAAAMAYVQVRTYLADG